MRRLLLALILTGTACTGPTVEPLRLGLVAEPGGSLDRAVRLTANQAREAGHRPIELVVVPPGPQAADRLAEVPVHAVVLPPDASLARAVLDRGLPALVAGPPPAEGLPHLVPGPAVEGRALAALLAEEGIATVALLVSDDPHHRAVADRFASDFPGEVVSRPLLAPDSEPTLPLQELIEADPEAVVCACRRGALPAVLREAFVMGLAGRPWYHTGQARDPSLPPEVFPEAPDRMAGQRGAALVVPDPTTGPGFPAFARAFEELAGSPPDGPAALAYDAAWLLILAARAGTPEDLARHLPAVSRAGRPCAGPDCLEALAEGVEIAYRGASGPADLAADGSPIPVRVEIWRFTLDGEIEVLETRSYRSGGSASSTG